MNQAANLIAVVAELIGLTANANQVIYVIRKRTIDGISGWSWTLGLGGNIAWVVYGLQKSVYALVVANFVIVIIAGYMLTRLYIHGSERKKMLLYALIVGIGLSAMFMSFRGFSGWLAFIYGTFARLPQLYRVTKDKSLRGLSPGSQISYFIENGLTVAYATILSAWPVGAAAFVGIFSSLYIIFQVAKKRGNG